MDVSRSTAALLFLVTFPGTMSCDPGTTAAGPDEQLHAVQHHRLEIRSCPEEESLSWTFEFGLDPDVDPDEEALDWPGSYFFSMGDPHGGVGGGGGGGSYCGCSHRPCPCSSDSGQSTTRRWKLSGEMDVNLIPDHFTMEVRAPRDLRPELFEPNAPLLKARFELGAPEHDEETGCVTIPVDTVSLTSASTETNVD